MNENLKAVILELSGGNIRNHHINLRGALGLFPADALGGSNKEAAARTVTLRIGGESVETDIDHEKAIFRERGAVRRFFEAEHLEEGDLVAVQRVNERTFEVWKASKRGFKYYL